MALLMSMLPVIYNIIRLGKALFMQDRATKRDTAVVSRITTTAMLKRPGEVMQIHNPTREDTSHPGEGGFHMDVALMANERN